LNLAKKYIDDVMTGRQVACEYVKKAVERHVNDLQIAEEKGWFFDEDSAQFVIDFVSFLRHTKGSFAKKRFNLQPWQAFIFWVIFGWKNKETGFRRFKKAYIEVSRKNGKSEIGAALGIYMLIADGEYGAEVYAAATKRDQARKVFDPAKSMLKQARAESKSLKKSTTVLTNRLVNESSESYFVTLSKDYDSEEGSNPHFAVVDEYHVHPTSGMLDMLESGMVQRNQSLLFIITTAGFQTASPCYEFRQSIVGLLNGERKNDSVFGIIYTLDEGDDWRDESVWVKATPNLGTGIPIQNFREALQKACGEGYTSEIAFRVKNLNQWINEAHGWINQKIWKAAAGIVDLEELKGQVCYGGLDLASTRDISALAIVFPPEGDDEKFSVFWRLYCPMEMIEDPSRNENGISYKQWWKDGFITGTDGNVTDYRYIEKDIQEINIHFQLKRIGYDRHNAYEIVTRLDESGIAMDPVPQTTLGLSVPMKQVERLVYSENFNHGNNPVINWMLGNIAIYIDGNENTKLDRKNKAEKIDGFAALLDAMNVYINNWNEDGMKSVYEKRGIRFI
jgi:phage terminase large subunit-like protein